MSCYTSHRPMYCYYGTLLGRVVVVGPFKTKTQAKKAAMRDGGEELVRNIRQLVPYADNKDRLVTLHFNQFLDPTRKAKSGVQPEL